MRILRLFPDTNLFLQCKSLNDLTWQEWSDFDEIQVIVCHVVQREIDRRKTGHNERTTRRARKTAARLRSIIQETSTGEVIRPASPRVLLLVSPHYWHTPDLPLDYTINDHQLVGVVHAATTQHHGEDVRLLTHDVFPLSTARGLGLHAEIIPDTWLLAPEPTSHEKKLLELQEELRILHAKEPRCIVDCQTSDGTTVDKIDIEYEFFPPLSPGQVNDVMQVITDVYPEKSDFGPLNTRKRTSNLGLLRFEETYLPVEAEDIKHYRKKYRKWRERCQSIVAQYHSILQERNDLERIVFVLRNMGTRPAEDVLISFMASGQLQIIVGCDSDANSHETSSDANLKCELTQWPIPPKGKWTSSLAQIAAGFQSLNRDPFGLVRPDLDSRPPFRPSDLTHLRRDPNDFRFRDGEAGMPDSRVSLTCDQLRHGEKVESFSVDVCNVAARGATGAISCQVEAANLSTMVRKVIPVTVNAKTMDTFSCVQQEIALLLGKTAVAGPSAATHVK